MKFTGKIVQGKFVPDIPEMYVVHISKLNGENVILDIKKHRSNRNLRQNNYYWGVVIEILRDHFGYSPEEMHEALKLHFLKKEEGPLPTVRSTTTLDTEEMTQYISNIMDWASQEYGLYVPSPGEL